MMIEEEYIVEAENPEQIFRWNENDDPLFEEHSTGPIYTNYEERQIIDVREVEER
jgi:hypothetical protein